MAGKTKIRFKNRQEVLNFISAKMDNSSKWAFISMKQSNTGITPCLMSPDRNHAFECIIRILKQEPEWLDVIKNTMEKSDIK